MPKDRKSKLGQYIGAEELFKGKRGIIKSFGEIVKMQFDDGPDWLTQSWITFPAGDVTVDNIQTMNVEGLIVGDGLLDFEKEVNDDDAV